MSFYPLGLYLGVGFCAGDFTREIIGDKWGVTVGGTFFRIEGLVVACLCFLNWIWTFWSSRTYHLPGEDGGFVPVRKWDPNHGALALSCLFSPVQVACFLMPYMHRDEDGKVRQSIVMWIVAVLHGWGSVLVAHMFMRKESVQRSINNSAYAKEVEFRNDELNKRRVAERQEIDRLKHKSKKFFSSNKGTDGVASWWGKAKVD